MIGWIGSVLRGLWGIARVSRVDVGEGLRPGSGAARLYLFLFLVCCLVALMLVALGVDLDRIDAWVDRHAGGFDRIGTLAFKALFGVILLVCLAIGGGFLLQRGRALVGSRDPDGPRFGWGAMLCALIIGYFAWVGLIM